MDVVEIGVKQLRTGGVYCVKLLGAYAMIDEGELDWKGALRDPRVCLRTLHCMQRTNSKMQSIIPSEVVPHSRNSPGFADAVFCGHTLVARLSYPR